jgi:predicted metal-dependent HD superfamily phosphohydrolase
MRRETKMERTYQQKIETLTRVVAELMPKLPYHNFGHAVEVYTAVSTLAGLGEVNSEDRFLLKSAALLHDIIFVPGRTDNEERSASFARQYLPRIDYSVEQSRKVGDLVLATKMPQKPRDYMEQLLCDADLYNLGGDEFFDRGEKLRQELGLPKETWDEFQLGFLREHQYHTDVARKIRDGGKRTNIQQLERKLLERSP